MCRNADKDRYQQRVTREDRRLQEPYHVNEELPRTPPAIDDATLPIMQDLANMSLNRGRSQAFSHPTASRSSRVLLPVPRAPPNSRTRPAYRPLSSPSIMVYLVIPHSCVDTDPPSEVVGEWPYEYPLHLIQNMDFEAIWNMASRVVERRWQRSIRSLVNHVDNLMGHPEYDVRMVRRMLLRGRHRGFGTSSICARRLRNLSSF